MKIKYRKLVILLILFTIVSCSNNEYVLINVAKNGTIVDIHKLVKTNKLDIDIKDKSGNSGLYYASFLGKIELVKWFIDHEANVNVKNNDGYTPLMMAALRGNLGCKNYLLKLETQCFPDNAKKTKLNVNNRKKDIKDISQRYIKIGKYLIKNGANVNNKGGTYSDTALEISVRYEYLSFIELLLVNGADTRISDTNNSIIMLATEGGNIEIVKKLIKYNADVNAQDKKGRTALMMAARSGYYNIVALLLKNNANPNLTTVIINKNCLSALDYAKIGQSYGKNVNKYIQIIKILKENSQSRPK